MPTPAKKAPVKKAASASSIVPVQIPPGYLLGSHTSISGGVTQAIPRAVACGFTAAQIFVKNNKQWFAPALAEAEITNFKQARKAANLYVCAHNSYLINLANQAEEMFETSVKAMIAELERAEALELPFIVMHPGSHGGAGEEAGLRRIVQGLDKIAAATAGFRCKMALEITAGQGTALGYQANHLGFLLANSCEPKRYGVCLDTAHLHGAGYPLSTREGYEETCTRLAEAFPWQQVLGFHLNDSKVPRGKRVDRHEHLGEGEIGLDCFRWIVEDPRWKGLPMILETPKSEDMHEDVENVTKLAPYLH